MYKKVLVPLDGSEFSECVLDHVRVIATGCSIPEVVLLRVLEPIQRQAYSMVPQDLVREVEEKAKNEMKDYLSKLAGELKKDGVNVETIVLSGRPEDEILDYADKNKVDLIIMSTHGRSGISRWVFGSIADRVVRHSMVPMLIVPPHGCRIG